MLTSLRKVSPKVVTRGRWVPAYSQFLDVALVDWRHRACGIVALKTVMDALGGRTPCADQLIKIGIGEKAYDYLDGNGWIHEGLVRVAKRFHFQAAPYDWSRKNLDAAWSDFQKVVHHIPCMTSIHRDFDTANGGHLIVVTKIIGGLVFYREPAARTREDIFGKTDVDTFQRGWRRRGVIVRRW